MKIGIASYTVDIVVTYLISLMMVSAIAFILYAGAIFSAMSVFAVAVVSLKRHLSQCYIALVADEFVIRHQFRKPEHIHVSYYKGISKEHRLIPFQNTLVLVVKGGEFKFVGGTTSATDWDKKIRDHIAQLTRS